MDVSGLRRRVFPVTGPRSRWRPAPDGGTAAEGPADWYVDAWAVRDGKLFASRRAPGALTADLTIFLSVPDLEPVPVGRISTALRATRSGFQEGLRDDEGAEIPFTGIPQLRELVRRGFLAGGLGPGSPSAVAGPVPRPDRGPGPGTAYLEQRLERYPAIDLVTPERGGPAVPPENLPVPEGLAAAVRDLALATILEWEVHLGPAAGVAEAAQAPEELRALAGWVSGLLRAGLLPWDDGPVTGPWWGGPWWGGDWHHAWLELGHLAAGHGAGAVGEALRTVAEALPAGVLMTPGQWWGETWTRGHLAVVPSPRPAPRWRGARLVEAQRLAFVDRRFWSGPVAAPDLAPAVLVELIGRGGHDLVRLPGEEDRFADAFRRGYADLTWQDLPGPADTALAGFIDRCLGGGTPEPSPASSTVPPPAPLVT